MPCFPSCIKTTSIDGQGHRIMISTPGNLQYPVPHTAHPQCESCLKEEIAEMLADIGKVKDAKILGPGLADKWQQTQDKTKRILNAKK